MTITYADYDELPGSPTETLDAKTGQVTAQRRFVCDWLDRYDVRNFLLGWENRAYEYDTNLYAMKVSMARYLDTPPEKESGDNNRVLYEKAELVVEYESIIGDYKSGTVEAGNVTGCDFAEEQLDTDIQFLTVPCGTLYWENDQTEAIDDGQAPTKMVPFINYTVSFHGAKAIPSTFYTLVGTVNTANYTFIEHNKIEIPGSLLFRGFSSRRSLNTFGTAGWDITCQFSRICNGAANGWNQFWNPDAQEWSSIYDSSGTAIEIYADADWSDLGIPATPS